VYNVGIQSIQEKWGAKRLMRVDRKRDAQFVGCTGYLSTACGGMPCDYRIQEEPCIHECPLQPRFELRKSTLEAARSRDGQSACSRECGHSIRTCRFTRHVSNWEELVAHYRSEDIVAQLIKKTHIEDMHAIAAMIPYQSFDDNSCANGCAPLVPCILSLSRTCLPARLCA
jgi:hypothetical protein